MADALLATGVPIVELRRQVVELDLPTVYCDDAAIGDLAVRHFQERGFRHFAFCGRPGARWSDLREPAFRRRLEAAGLACHSYAGPAAAAGRPGSRSRTTSRAGSPRCPSRSPSSPATTSAASRCSTPAAGSACRSPSASPSSASTTTSSSASSPTRRSRASTRTWSGSATRRPRCSTGSWAARPADRARPGRAAGVVTRLSTDSVAIDDPAVATALRLIRQHACDHGVDFLADRTGSLAASSSGGSRP